MQRVNLSPFPHSLSISSLFPHSISISSSFPHSLSISSQPGCKAATIRAALFVSNNNIILIIITVTNLELFATVIGNFKFQILLDETPGVFNPGKKKRMPVSNTFFLSCNLSLKQINLRAINSSRQHTYIKIIFNNQTI